MSSSDKKRWQQRLDNFEKALDQLRLACKKQQYTDLERAGLVQMFEFTFELGWKTLKDLLFFEGYDVKTPREIIRKAYEAGYLDENDTETYLEALDKRNILSHTYQQELAEQAQKLITQSYCPMFTRLYDRLTKKRSE